MKAAFIVGRRQIEIRDLPDPVAPPGGVVLRVEACGVCGSDLRAWRDGFRIEIREQVPGHEVAGVVVDVGAGAPDRFRVGDAWAVAADVSCYRCKYCRRGFPNLCENHRILGTHFPGGMAEFLVLTEEMLHGGILHPVPEGVSPTEAAMAEPLASVIASQEDAGVQLGDTVVVYGAGPIGCLHGAVARSRGARVILVDPAQQRLEMARQVVHAAVYVAAAGEAAVETVMRETDGAGADVAIVAAPVAAAVSQAIASTRKRGTVILFGGLPRSTPEAAVDVNRIHYNELTVRGAFSYRPHHHQRALAVISEGRIPIGALVTHELPLDRIEEAFRILDEGKALKVCIRPQSAAR